MAKKEVIISAGSINSPKLLMLSGIGPKEHLQEVDIYPSVDLPAVGQNLQDHIMSIIGPFLLNQPASFVLDRDNNLKILTDYLYNGTGPITSIAGISGLALLPSSTSGTENYPDIYLNHVGVGVHSSLGREQEQGFGLLSGVMQTYLQPHVGKDAFFGVVNLGRPKSTGVVKLRSKDPFVYPTVNPKYLSHPDDIRLMIEGVKAVLNIYENTTTFQKLGAELVANKFPTCDDVEFRSDAYWECYVRSLTLTVYHPCGTCRMGKVGENQTSVVDPRLRVHGVKNLRVVDASVIPRITNANLNAPTIMIGEKGADLILQDWEISSTKFLQKQGNPPQAKVKETESTERSGNVNKTSADKPEDDYPYYGALDKNDVDLPVYVLDPRKK
jgi:choline dehydrogenase-like flavoprotein